jgi:hypothetical protein
MEANPKTARKAAPKKTTEKVSARPGGASKARELIKGQTWRIARGHAQILHIGRTLVQYRFIKTGMVRGSLEIKSIANFAEALHANNAELLD